MYYVAMQMAKTVDCIRDTSTGKRGECYQNNGTYISIWGI